MNEEQKPSLNGYSDAGNFAALNESKDYFLYFSQLQLVFQCLSGCFHHKSGADALLADSITRFLEKLAYTMGVLRMKYGFNRKDKLRVDITDSGFPNAMEFNQILVGMERRDAKLAEPPTSQTLKQEMLDFMFNMLEEPYELLERMGERWYYKLLEKDKLFLPFTPGTVILNGETDSLRKYSFSWACFDFATNRPALHIIHFEQDSDSDPLDDLNSDSYQRFEEAVSSEGSRMPPLGIIAIGIDNALEDIHPKLLRRITLGPITTRQFSRDPREISELLTKYSHSENDFVLFGDEETVFSVDQKIQHGFFSAGKKREIFHFPVSDQECFERKVSKVSRFMILPHVLLQHMDFSGEFKQYHRYQKIAYDQKGGVYAI